MFGSARATAGDMYHSRGLDFALWAYFVVTVHGFQFTFTPPKSCGSLNVSWTGGQPPFALNVIPVFGTPYDISIPSSAFSNGAGSFSSTLLNLENSTGVVLAMSDATGFASGGISEVQKLDSKNPGSCATPDPLIWVYDNPQALTQCANYVLNSFNGTSINGTFTPPLTFTALVPGGSFLTLPTSGPKPTSISWLASVPGGTQMIFFGKDAAGQQGGSTDLLTVGRSDDKTCFTPGVKDISTTTNAPSSATATSTNISPSSPTDSSSSQPSTGTSPTNSTTPDPDKSSTNTSLIAGLVASLLGLLILGASSYFCLKARQRRRALMMDRHAKRSSFDFDASPGAELSPFTLHSPSAGAGPGPGPYRDDVDGSSARPGSQAPSTVPGGLYTPASAKGGVMPPAETRERMIVHTDIEELPREGREELIELPPMYSAGRAPMSSLVGGQVGAAEAVGDGVMGERPRKN